MNDNVNFTRTGFEQYVYWQSQDRKTRELYTAKQRLYIIFIDK